MSLVRNSLTVFYGPKQITDGGVLDKITASIEKHEDFLVNNDSMEYDPAPQSLKFAMAYYRLSDNSPALRQRLAAEHETFKFSTDIQAMTYGNKPVTDTTVYLAAYNDMLADKPFAANNNTMNGDPLEHTAKYATVTYYRNGQHSVQESVKEGDSFKWNATNQ